MHQAMTILNLKSIVAGTSAVPHYVNFTAEIGIRLVVKVLTHELAACRTDIGESHRIRFSETLLERCVPLVGSG